MSETLNILLRVILALTLLFIATKVLTKRSLSNLTYFDHVAGATLGTIAGNLAFNIKITVIAFISSIIFATLIILLVSYLSLKFRPFRRILAGEPTIIIKDGKILEHNMTKLNYSFDYLLEQLRQEKVFDVSKVEFAILESSGKLSVLLKSTDRPLTPQDLNIATSYEGLATEVILEGKIVENNLQQHGLNLEWLYKELHKKGIQYIEKVAFAALATNGNLYIDLYQDSG